ncbi:BglG family transcription antiterminator [Sediminibacillus albus]|uniref:Mannitol operon transcriptional antiterminator n=1 Tax=Sediminibacillus albus TaxID=407036 RepID=A0A1G8Y751_9BACI|nr:BglG family transcription antiterminator [Sediminibacillus albus]SDJ98244.1 mannitol operon transcriptional antiterminator [Sediminibacillus albus]
MNLDKRSTAILTQIVHSDLYIPVEKLAEQFNISRRTVYNDLDKINFWLNENKISEIQQIRAAGLYLEKQAKQEIMSKLLVFPVYYYELSPEERKAWLVIYFLASETPLFLKDLITITRVSRNTVLEDLKGLREELERYHLELTSRRKLGYQVVGMEADKRGALVNYIAMIKPQHGWYPLINGSTSEAVKQIEKDSNYAIFNQSELSRIYRALSRCEQRLGIQFTDEVLNTLVIRFYLFLQRIKQQQYVEIDPVEQTVIEQTQEFEAANDIIRGLESVWHINVPEAEGFYFAKHLLGSKVNYNLSFQDEAEEITGLREVVRKMIEDFQLVAVVSFSDIPGMETNLLLHLKPAYYRIKYGIDMGEQPYESVEDNFPEIYQLTKRVIPSFERFVGKEIDQREIAYIAIHFSGWLHKEGLSIQHRKKMLIVCTNGLGTSRLLQSQLEGLFSEVDITGIASLREYQQTELAVDFIVSTVPLQDRGVPVCLVNPLLDNHDKEKLLKQVNALFADGNGYHHYSVDTLVDIVKRYAPIDEEGQLRQELRKYLYQPTVASEARWKPSLKELLNEDNIVMKNSCPSWQQAVKKAANPLLEKDLITDGYVDVLIDNIEKHGPYVVLSPFIAMPHGRAEDGVKQLGISLLHLQEPVEMMGKKVRIFIVLAPEHNEKHLKALAQLTSMFNHDKRALLDATNIEQICKIITTYSSR